MSHIERAKIQDLWRPLRDRIYTPQESESRINEQNGDVVLFGTYSLSYLTEGLDCSGLTLNPIERPILHAHEGVSINLAKEHWGAVMGMDCIDSVSAEELTLRYNREGYGETWGMLDCIRDHTDNIDTVFMLYLMEIGLLIDKYHRLGADHMTGLIELIDHVEEGQFNHITKDEYDTARMYHALRGIWGTKDQIYSVFDKAEKRKGVQVVFGGKSTISTLRDSEVVESANYGIEIHLMDAVSFPLDAVQAIIPIGIYEQEQLGLQTTS